MGTFDVSIIHNGPDNTWPNLAAKKHKSYNNSVRSHFGSSLQHTTRASWHTAQREQIQHKCQGTRPTKYTGIFDVSIIHNGPDNTWQKLAAKKHTNYNNSVRSHFGSSLQHTTRASWNTAQREQIQHKCQGTRPNKYTQAWQKIYQDSCNGFAPHAPVDSCKTVLWCRGHGVAHVIPYNNISSKRGRNYSAPLLPMNMAEFSHGV